MYAIINNNPNSFVRPAEALSTAGGDAGMVPAGEECLPFFIVAFLRQLPNELRLLLGHNDFKDLKAVSLKADALWQWCPHRDPLAAIAEMPENASAAAPIAGVGQRPAKDHSATPSGHQFGAKAHSCADLSVCMWAEN
jgi:hypothetical protein